MKILWLLGGVCDGCESRLHFGIKDLNCKWGGAACGHSEVNFSQWEFSVNDSF